MKNGSTTNGIGAAHAPAELDVARLFRGARLLVLGGTGFLGKVFWAMLLDRYPEIDRVYLVVRPKSASASASPGARFWNDVATSEALGPLRRAHGDRYKDFLREKIVPIDGDMKRPLCGLDPALLRELRGTVHAVVNVAGVVDFNPPLDEAIGANAFGAQNLVALARALGTPERRTAIYHTSTCYVAGRRDGPIYEEDPRVHPFPRAGESPELTPEAWDPDREIAECLDLVAQAKHRAEDAFRQSEFAETARKNLASRGDPIEGPAYDAELARVKRRFVSDRIIEGGLDRATHWGWPNIYTYTKSIGEQVIAAGGVPFTITRPACCESCVSFPERSYSEGINTSAPLLYLMMKGQVQILASHVPLDLIPTDYVVAGMILALAELIEGTAPPVYQLGASDINPCTAQRFGEMVGMYKRQFMLRGGDGTNPLLAALAARVEPSFVGRERYDRVGPPAIAKAARGVASFLRGAVPALAPAAKVLEDQASRTSKVGMIQELFEPFSSKLNGPFDCSNARAAYARATPEDKAKLHWVPEDLDWRDWMMNIHMPAIEKRVVPELDRRLRKEPRAITPHETLVTLLDQMATRHDLALALQQVSADGLTRVTFRDVKRRADAIAARLAALGVTKGQRVVLAAQSQPAWAAAYFGILRAGAVAVPIDPALDAIGWRSVLAESEAGVVVWDETVSARDAVLAEARPPVALDLEAATAPDDALAPPEVAIAPGDVASLLFTSGTTSRPKGVMLTHANFTSLVAALAPIFPLSRGDVVLSVLPLHHTFEFTCGLLLPLSRGARVVYVNERTSEGITEGLRAARATAMVGVPALWQLLERRILQQVDARGPVARAAFDAATAANTWLASNLGVDAGGVLFGAVHDQLGGRMKWLISGGAALPRETQELFFGLGLSLTQGYGLTEAAPVLTVARPGRRLEAGVGKPVPGVEVRIDKADDRGVGEVVARGANVMAGYTDPDATRAVVDDDGWLHTGDVGRVDKKGRLEILGRVKDVVIAPSGENVYPDDVEARLGAVPDVAELAVVGVDVRGGERLVLLAVPAGAASEDDATGRNARARASLRAAIEALPPAMRPAIVHLSAASLPRTTTRKVKRDEVRAVLARLIAAAGRPEGAVDDATPARVAVAAVTGVSIEAVAAHASLQGELGFDSLLLSELHEALESRYGALDPQRLQACVTVADVDALVAALASPARGLEAKLPSRAPATPLAPLVLPEPLQEVGKALIGKAQDFFYGEVMKPRVYGRAHIPYNRNVIVVANHASHLDMGLVRHALGTYGEGIVSLAAQDYFFENRLKRAFFENLTNLAAIDRKASLRQSIRQATELLDRGKTLLVFPEGTRSSSGEVQEFKPLIGHLSLAGGVDILPLFLGGTHAAMPKGAPVPMKRALIARIGPPLGVDDLRRLTREMSPADAAREVARIAHAAVLALRDGQVLDLARATAEELAVEAENPLVELFAELETKFRAGEVEKPVSYYVSLGNDDLAKWTVRVDAAKCDVRPGKPAGGEADCVLKTSPEIFAKIVRESYVPSPADFMSGVFKSNDVALLMTFQRVFQLDQAP
jgi:long-chain acyl-CoA synthetase